MAVQRVLYRLRTGVKWGASAAPDEGEAWALFLALGGNCAPEDGKWQAAVAMQDLVRGLYSETPPRSDLRVAEVARAYHLYCCEATCQSNYPVYLEQDVTTAVTNTARLGVRLGTVCAHVIESLNAILKCAYNDHTARGRGGGGAGGENIRTGGGGGVAGGGC